MFFLWKKKCEGPKISEKHQFVGQLLGVSPSVFFAVSRTSGYSPVQTIISKFTWGFFKNRSQKKLQGLFFGSAKNGVFHCFSTYTGWERTLDPPPQPQLQLSEKIYTYSIKILSMSDSGAKFQESELIFNGWKLLF